MFRIFILILLSQAQLALATDYFFSAREDHLFENPANWTPAYPGHEIKAGDQIYIQDEVYVNAPMIRLEGNLKILLGVEFIATRTDMKIGREATLENAGKLILRELTNLGSIVNRQGARIHLDTYHGRQESLMQNLSEFGCLEKLENLGRFDNFNTVHVEGDFRNYAVFNQIRNSKLLVSGELLLNPGCVVNQSPESNILLGAQKKVVLEHHILAIFQ